MATLATLYDRLLGKGGSYAEAQAQYGAAPRRAATNRLRPFPNEDVHLHVKRIDNSRVIRADDPHTPRVCWRLIGGASASAVLLIGMLLPSGYRLMAGYQLEELRKENDRLSRQQSELETAEHKLLNPERLAELAKLQDFVDPDPGRIVHLPERSTTQTAVAAVVSAPPQAETQQ